MTLESHGVISLHYHLIRYHYVSGAHENIHFLKAMTKHPGTKYFPILKVRYVIKGVQCTHTSIFRGHMCVHEAEGVRLLDNVPRVLAGAIMVRGIGNDLIAGELLGQVDDLSLIIVDGEVVARLPDGGRGRGKGPR